MVDIAQLVSVPGCGPGGRGFESHYSPHFEKTERFYIKNAVYLLHNLKIGDMINCVDTLGVSPSGKAPDFDSGIRRFKSCYPCQI